MKNDNFHRDPPAQRGETIFRVPTIKIYAKEQKATSKNTVPPSLLPEWPLWFKLSSSSALRGSHDKNIMGLSCTRVVRRDSLKRPDRSLDTSVSSLTSQILSIVVLIMGASRRVELWKVVNKAYEVPSVPLGHSSIIIIERGFRRSSS